MDWKTMLSYISGSVDEELLLRNEYLVAENRILRNQLQGRLRLTDGERRSLAEFGKRLGKQALDEVASIVNPDTIFLSRRGAASTYASSGQRVFTARSSRRAGTVVSSRSNGERCTEPRGDSKTRSITPRTPQH